MSDAPKPDFIAPTVIGISLLAIVLWVAFGSSIRERTWTAMRAQAVVMQHVMPLYPESYRRDFNRFVRILKRPVPEDLPASTLFEAISMSGRFLALPASIGLVLTGIWIWRRAPAVRYRRRLDFEGLLRHNAKVFPRIRPVLWLEGKTKREERGNFWWPLPPYEWAVIVKALTPKRDPKLTRATWRPDAASAAFGAQLGRPSTEPRTFAEDLLLAIFAARILGDKKAADQLMDAASAGFGPAWTARERLIRTLKGKLYTDWPANGPWEIRLDPKAEALLDSMLKRFNRGAAEYLDSARVADDPLSPEGQLAACYFASAHIRCSLSRLLGAAQDTGIVSTSDFLWVKAIDRCLHYALNDVGRRVASIESSGIRAHMQAETAAGSRLSQPHVSEAVRALEIHLDETGWAPPPAMDYESYLKSFSANTAALDAALADKPPMPAPPADTGAFSSVGA
ncbi:hypothetical protein [Dolichospermum phage Dfl-JY45]